MDVPGPPHKCNVNTFYARWQGTRSDAFFLLAKHVGLASWGTINLLTLFIQDAGLCDGNSSNSIAHKLFANIDDRATLTSVLAPDPELQV